MDGTTYQFQKLFHLDQLQKIQDAFAVATGLACVITDPNGTPLTQPSRFSSYCQLVRSSTQGLERCKKSDARFGWLNQVGPRVETCLSGFLLDGGIGITVEGKHVANWLLGQVRDEKSDESFLPCLAKEIGVDETKLTEAYRAVPTMKRTRFEEICQALNVIADQLSIIAVRNIQQRQTIVALQRTEAELRESEERYRMLLQHSSEAIVLLDPDTRKVIEANCHFQEMLGYSAAELIGMPVYQFVFDDPVSIDRYYEEVLPRQRELPIESRCFLHKDGRVVEVERSGALVHLHGKNVYMVTARDVTERKFFETKLKYLSYHDMLTGLKNRTCFEEEMNRIDQSGEVDTGLIVFDLDGLKLVNDTFGHEQGDFLLVRTAELIRDCFPESDLVARIGGDEIAVLMRQTTSEAMEQAVASVLEKVTELQRNARRIPLSLSFGFAFRQDSRMTMRELFREADNKMYRAKLHQSQSARGTIVQTVMSMLEARDFITEGHADRLQEILITLARAAGMQESRMTDLRLLAQFHDIGKVGIPDRILLKPGPLEAAEVVEMQRHSEIGHRIAQSSADLLPIADWVLKHQEWWNGKGYPLGLAGREIPLECRILAIADAYDAMTNDRPYRSAMSHDQAISELRRCAGTQFDPELVEMFIRIWGSKTAE